MCNGRLKMNTKADVVWLEGSRPFSHYYHECKENCYGNHIWFDGVEWEINGVRGLRYCPYCGKKLPEEKELIK
jgi:hypothetical protein